MTGENRELVEYCIGIAEVMGSNPGTFDATQSMCVRVVTR